MTKEFFSIVNIVNNDGCFDLQFRKDTRHERTNSPTYYRWKAQFIITTPVINIKILNNVAKEFGCGNISASKSQARFSVQKIDDIVNVIIPYFKKNYLSGNKKNDFNLWEKGARIIYQNKRKQLTSWKKSDLLQLIEIQKSGAKYKNNPRTPKWFEMAQVISKSF